MPDSFYLQSCPNDFAVGGQRVPGPESECLSLSLLTIKTRKSSFQRHAQRKQPEPGWIAHIALMPAWSSDQSSDTPSWCCRLGCSYVSSVAAWTPCWINSVSFFFELWNYSSVLPTVELLFIDSWCMCSNLHLLFISVYYLHWALTLGQNDAKHELWNSMAGQSKSIRVKKNGENNGGK